MSESFLINKGTNIYFSQRPGFESRQAKVGDIANVSKRLSFIF